MSIVFEYIDKLEAAINSGQCDDDLIEDTVSTFSDLEGIKKGLDRYRSRVITIGSAVVYDNQGDARKLRDKLRRHAEESGMKRDLCGVSEGLTNSALSDLLMIRDEAVLLFNNANPYSAESSGFTAWRVRVSRFFGKYPELASGFRDQIESMSFVTEYSGTNDVEMTHATEDFRQGMQAAIACLDVMVEECNDKSFRPAAVISDNGVPNRNGKVFIVHGHNHAALNETKMLLEHQGIESVVLAEQANVGKTIIEKLEAHSDVQAAVLLLTADDEGHLCSESKLNYRARQNVIFEAGLFIGKLERSSVVLVVDPDVEIPSDILGLGYIERKDGWKLKLLTELKSMGFAVDANKLL